MTTAGGCTAFREASALAPVPLRLRDQAQLGQSDAPFLPGRLSLSLTDSRREARTPPQTPARQAA